MKTNRKTIITYIASFLLGVVITNITFFVATQKNSNIKTTVQYTSPTKLDNDLDSKLNKINEELAIIKADQRAITATLGISTSSADVAKANDSLINSNTTTAGAGKLKILNSSISRINVYFEPKTTSKIMAQIVYGQEYTYQSRDGDWYKLDRPAGYVNSESVIEIK